MPKVFEHCPQCRKKGLYLSNGYPYWGDGTKCCRYCNYCIGPEKQKEEARNMAKNPKFGFADGDPSLPQTPAPEADLRVRTERDEVLAGIDKRGRLFHVWEKDFAVGPGNLRYSHQTLLALEAEGVIIARVDSQVWAFADFVKRKKAIEKEEPAYDDSGVIGNAPSTLLTWERQK